MNRFRRNIRKRHWFLIAILGSLLVHAILFFWFQRTFLPQTILPTAEQLQLRKFKLERVQIDPKWLAPKLDQPVQRIPNATPDRSALTPSDEKRTFAELLSKTPSSPTMPAGSPKIPQDKPVPSLELSDKPSFQSATRSQLDEELKSLRDQQMRQDLKNGGAGKPILPTPGAPVAPKQNVEGLAPPTQPIIGASKGPQTGSPHAGSGTGRVEDFFGAQGGLPPIPMEVPKTDAASQVPQSLNDNPALKAQMQYESLNPFLNVELFTYERRNSKNVAEGYFLVRVTAKPNKQLSVIPKDVFFVMDISSSIGRDRLNTFIETLLDSISKLNPNDRFKILVFRDKLSAFQPGWTPAANPPMDALKAWLKELKTGGVTDFYEGLSPLLTYTREKGRVGIAVVMSDGVPTKGVLDSTEIISDFSEDNGSKTSIFTLSNGRDVNNFLLDLLSYCNQGWLRYSEQVEASVPLFDQLSQQIRNPLFLDLRFRFAGIDAEQVYPQSLPHLYQDSPLFLFGRYTPGQTKQLSLQILGESQRSTKELLVQLPIPAAPNGPETLPATWARQRIYYLLSKMTRSRGRRDDILDEVRTLSEEYKIEVPYF